MGSNYADVYDRSLRDPEGFWSEEAQEIDWIETWNQVIDTSNAPFCRWFVGGVLNTCTTPLICMWKPAAPTRPL